MPFGAFFALLPIAFHCIIIMVILRYPLSRKVHQSIRTGIDALKRGENTEDPIRRKTLVPIKPENEETMWFLDNFSVRELKKIAGRGTSSLVGGIYRDILIFGFAAVAAIAGTVWLLQGALSLASADQLRQGAGSCLIVVAGVSLTLMVFHIFRISAAKKMMASPPSTEVIQNHIINL